MDAPHTRRLACQAFDHPAHQILLAEYCQAIEDAGVRLDRLSKLVVETAASWSMAPVVAAYQAMRGVAGGGLTIIDHKSFVRSFRFLGEAGTSQAVRAGGPNSSARGTTSAQRHLAFMRSVAPIATLALVFSFGVVAAQELRPAAVNTASLASIAVERPSKPSPDPDPAIVRLQVLLDRAGSSPGVVDGLYGENLHKAVAGFEAMNGLLSDGKLDPDLITRLETNSPIVESYVVTKEDATGLVDHIPADYGEKAKMESMGYTSVAERLSERFHMGIDLMKTLNPGSDFAPGKTVQVVTTGPPKTGNVKRIEANKKTGQVLAYDESGSLLSVYPATVGSKDNPSPAGTRKVKGVAKMPVYRYDPKVNFKQGKNTKVLTIPKGPNSPVGTVWIDLTEPTYGIHGTPDPELIDKGASHGCVRLTNWDAEELAGMVKPGVLVKFVN